MSDNNEIYLSPLVRFRLTASHEIELAGNLYDKDRHDKCIKRYETAEAKRDSLLRSVIIFDAVSIILIAGKSVKIPTLDIQIGDIPAGAEIVLLISAINMLFLSLAFITHLSYAAMIENYNTVKYKSRPFDPEFVTLTEKHEELCLKIFRQKMNIYGIDFFTPGWRYRIMGTIVIGSVVVSMVLVFLSHLLIQGYGTYILFSNGAKIVHFGLSAFLLLLNCTAAMVFILSNVKFKFVLTPDHRPNPTPPSSSATEAGAMENFDPSI